MKSIDRYRLAVVTSHPVQYQAPLFKRLAEHPQIDLTVYYGSDSSIRGELDRDFGVPVQWDRPLLEGYHSIFMNAGKDWNSGRANIIQTLIRQQYDAVFIHSYATSLSLMAYAGAWLSRTPVLLRNESELIRPRRPLVLATKRVLLNALFRHTAGFLSIGSANRAFYRYYGVPETRIYHTPYSVDNDFFAIEGSKWISHKKELKSEMGLMPSQPVILFSGKLIPRKRPLDLLNAYLRIVKEGVPASLLFVGEGELRSDIEKIVVENKLDQVRITGFQNQTQLPRFYAMGDIFVLPSEFDPWGLVVNEAMLFSMPVIVSDRVGAGADLVQDGITGFVYPVGEIEQLASHLVELARDSERCKQIGLSARERISDWNFDICVGEIVRAVSDTSSRNNKCL